MTYQISTLTNGLRVATVSLPHFDSVNTAVYIRTGSRDETEENGGIAHFLEHMAFKGTTNRTALDISQEIEVLGSYMNAFTNKNMTAYYTVGLGRHAEASMRVLSDIVLNSMFDPSDIDLERGVILQEISKYNDDPGSLARDAIDRTLYPDHAYGRPILGTPDFIRSVPRQAFMDFVSTNYVASNMLLLAVGAVEHRHFVDLACRYFDGLPTGTVANRTIPAQGSGTKYVTDRPFEQASVRIAVPIPAFTENASAAPELAMVALAGGMSSPLFQEIREKRGLVYSVFGYGYSGTDVGEAVIGAGMTPDNLREFFDVILDMAHNVRNIITPADLERAKNTNLVDIATLKESISSLSRIIAEDIFNFGRYMSPDERAAKITAVTMDDVLEATSVMLLHKPAIALVGPVEGFEPF